MSAGGGRRRRTRRPIAGPRSVLSVISDGRWTVSRIVARLVALREVTAPSVKSKGELGWLRAVDVEPDA